MVVALMYLSKDSHRSCRQNVVLVFKFLSACLVECLALT
jgi:hypothetical protein